MNKAKIAITLLFVVVISLVGYFAGQVWLIQHDNEKIKFGRDQMYQEHYANVATDAQRRTAIEDKIREGIEQGLKKSTEQFEASQAGRVAADDVTRDKVELLIQQNPDYYTNRLCSIPDDMLAQRNKIRLNGGN